MNRAIQIRKAVEKLTGEDVCYNDAHRIYAPTSQRSTWIRCRRLNMGGFSVPLQKAPLLKKLGAIVQRRGARYCSDRYGITYIFLPSKQVEDAVIKAAAKMKTKVVKYNFSGYVTVCVNMLATSEREAELKLKKKYGKTAMIDVYQD